MKEQLPDDSDFALSDSDDLASDTAKLSPSNATIFKKDGINPAKRRRLEALREERELKENLREFFDEE